MKLWSTGDTEYLSKAEGLSVPYEDEGASGNSSSAGFVGVDASVSEDVYYENCDAVRVAGKNPILKGEPGFREQFDGDRDGGG